MNNTESYSLSDSDNYKKELNQSARHIFEKYTDILNAYIENYIKSNYTNVLYIKNVQFYYYLLDKGISTINHIFTILLLYTKNIELTIHYCTKVIYYYIEFIGQNTEQNENKINYNNASLFSYSKTIYNLNKSYKKNINQDMHINFTELEYNNERNELFLFASINKMITLYQIILNRHLTKYSSEKTESKSISNEDISDKYLLIYYIKSNMTKCLNYILNMIYSEQEMYIIMVKYLSLEEMYDCKLIDDILKDEL